MGHGRAHQTLKDDIARGLHKDQSVHISEQDFVVVKRFHKKKKKRKLRTPND